MMAVLPLPFVPAIWMTGQARCGEPNRSHNAATRAVPGAIRCSGQRAMSRWTIC